eukprot:9489191-Pyramimonas_sp.AAC.1
MRWKPTCVWVGPGPQDSKSPSILVRIVEWNRARLWCEVGQGHAEVFVGELSWDQCEVRCQMRGEKQPCEKEDEGSLPNHD